MSYGKDDSYSSNTRGSGYDDDSYGTGRGDLRRDATTRSNDGLASGGRGYDEDDTYGSSGARGTRRNDGLETSTGGAYGTDTQGYGSSTTRRNDGLSSGMDDSYEARSSGYDSTRANDGLATSGDDSYGGSTGRRRDDEYSSRTADQDLSGGLRSDRTTGGRYDDSSYGGMLRPFEPKFRPADTRQKEHLEGWVVMTPWVRTSELVVSVEEGTNRPHDTLPVV